ncbi:MAG: uroporphyrinogen decarboxylase [Gemmatimonadaceae bacterium]
MQTTEHATNGPGPISGGAASASRIAAASPTSPASLFMRAARREPVERTPVWFMRQAGRVLPEYRAIRERWTLIEICRQPELCAEVTLQPVQRFNPDAAILFADIMLPLLGSGVALELVDEVGPVIASPVRDLAGVRALRPLQPEADVSFVLDAIRLVRQALGGAIPLIGFSGAPFTLASYLIEGRPSRDFAHTKAMMYGAPELWHALMERLAELVIAYLQAQVRHGIDALQLFDSWVGCLAPDDYAQYAAPYTRRILAALAPAGLPMIHFGTGTSTLLAQMKDDGASIIGVDWRLPLDDAWTRIAPLGIQGNLDPAVLLAPPPVIEARVLEVLRRAGGRPGHIFNLGHGLLPSTPIASVHHVIDVVRANRSEEIREVTATTVPSA